MDKARLFQFISKQKTAFIASVEEQGHPVVRAVSTPRIIDGEIYFSTNTSSNKVKQYLANGRACVYFYKRGLIKYQGASLIGEMQVCTDQATKDKIWRTFDKLFYKQGVTDPDYCVLKFVGKSAEYYCDLKIETIEL